MLRKFFTVLCVGLVFVPVLTLSAQVQSPPALDMGAPLKRAPSGKTASLYQSFSHQFVAASTVGDVSHWVSHQLRPGEALQCLALRNGIMPDAMAQVNHILNPTLPTHRQTVLMPSADLARNVRPARRTDTRLAVAMQHDVDLWEVARHNPLPLYAGHTLLLPGPGPEQCWPYPLVDMTLGPQPVVRGRTVVLALETAEPAACEVTYAGQTAPCYATDATHLYALLGLSALMDAGEYKIELTLYAEGSQTSLDFYLQVQPGRYGFQFINPPASLSQLMDAALMQGEMDYLATWRQVRTPERQWEFPLAFPLSRKFSISADYGARRSYGGLVDGYHSGVDYRAWTGISVIAPAEGVVLMAEHLLARGNAVLIDHGWGLVTGYWHMSKIDVEVGQHVTRGEVIGKVGNTGLSTGSHLHWEVWVNGVSVDGKQWLDSKGLAEYELPALSAPDSAAELVFADPQ